MSTSAVIPNPSTSAALPIKNEITTFAVVVKQAPDGKVVSVRHTSSEKNIAELDSPDYKGDEQIAFKQAVSSPKVGTLEGFQTLITDPDEQINIINKGIASKFNQKIRTALIEQDEAGNLVFQPTDAVYDATPLVQAESLRTNLSPTDKAIATLAKAGLSEEDLAAIFASIKAASAGSPSEVAA